LAALDPAAATAGWIARLPATQRAAAHAATDWRLAAWLGGGLIFIGACVVVARNDTLGKLRRWVEAKRPQPWLASAIAAGALTLILGSVNAMVGGLAGWRADALLARGGGFPAPAGFEAHVGAAGAGIPLAVLAAMALVPPLLWLMRRLPRTWPLAAGAAATAVILGLFWLPYALGAAPPMAPAPPSPARDGVLQLIAEARLPAQGVLAAPTPGFDADVIGGFGHAKVLMGRALLAGPPGEARADVGHLMGHYVHNDILIVSLVGAAVILAGFFAMQRGALAVARLIGVKGATDAADPVVLPALAAIAYVTLILVALAGGAYLRAANVGADAYSLDHARAPDGLVAVLEHDWNHLAVDPSPLAEAVLYTHPPLQGRIRQAMAWKAAHGGG
jgi:STE24 endopeptidase